VKIRLLAIRPHGLGTGFCALILGAKKYYALDLIDFTDPKVNVSIFDELVALFRKKAPIPSTGIHSLRFPELDCYEFPEFLNFEPNKEFEDRMVKLRTDIALKTGEYVEVAAPWTELSIINSNSIDWIFSQSVLEHIDDLRGIYKAMNNWLKLNGYMTHLIDFSSHNLTFEWNGHWAIKKQLWSILRGKRPYLINRIPYSEYIRLAEDNGFSTILEKRYKRFDGLTTGQFTTSFSGNEEDTRTAMVFLVQRLDPVRAR